MRPTFHPVLALLILAFVGVSGSRAQFVVPTGYGFSVATNSDSGNSYPDSGGELTNGVLGLNFSNYNNASEAGVWTGWINLAPTITFQFAAPQTFSRIELGTTWGIAGIGLPTSVTISGTTFNLSGNEFTSNTRDWLAFDGTFSTTLVSGIPTLTVALGGSHSQWIMLDEVRFTAVPEPADTTIVISLAAIGALVLVRWSRCSPARVA